MNLKILLLLSTSVIVSSCADGWIGAADNKTKHTGKRVSILAHEQLLLADKNLKEEIIIPKEEINKNWSISDLNQNIIRTENFSINNNNNQISKISFSKPNINIPHISPIVYNKNIITNNQNIISLYDENNNLKWKAKLVSKSKTLYGGGIFAEDENIFATFGDKTICNISSKDGKILWQTELENISRSAPIIDGNKVFITTVNNQIYALDKISGEILWHHYIIAPNISTAQYASPVIYKNTILVPYSTGDLYILDSNTGNEINVISLEKNTFFGTNTVVKDIDITPVIRDDNIYIINQEDTLYSINLLNGEINWELTLLDFKHFWMAGNIIYMASFDGQVTAVSKKTGKIHWVSNINLQKNDNINNITMANSKIMLSSELGNIYDINPSNGALIAESKVAQSLIQNPLFANNNIYYITNNVIQIWK